MANRGRIQSFARRGPRRQTDWAFGFITTARVAVPASSKVLLASLTAALIDPFRPFTIVRTRGILLIESDQTAVSESQMGGVGLTFVSEPARVAGAASLPGPTTDFGHEGWFMHQFVTSRVEVASAIGAQNPAGTQYVIDSKAMRKDGDALVLMAENTNGTSAFTVTVFLRLLMKAG